MIPMLFDPLYMIMWLPGLILAGWAQLKVKTTFGKYQKIRNHRGINGAEAASRILQSAGLSNVRIETAHGFLGDHYDPRTKVLRLSEEVYSQASLSAVGVAAHEAGHAIQDARGYAPLKIRSHLVPVASIGSNLAFPLLFLGMFIGSLGLMKLGVILFGAAVLFQLVTLPVEFDASRRAMASLTSAGVLDMDETQGAREVLNAAAMTYVAAAVAAVMQLVYFLMRSGLLGGSDE